MELLQNSVALVNKHHMSERDIGRIKEPHRLSSPEERLHFPQIPGAAQACADFKQAGTTFPFIGISDTRSGAHVGFLAFGCADWGP